MKLIELSAIDITIYKFVLPLMHKLREQGWDISVCASDVGYRKSIVEEGYIVHDVDIQRSLSPIKIITTLYKLIKLMKSEKPDCIHVHTPIAALLARLAGKIVGVPHIVYTLHGLYMQTPFLQLEKWVCKYCTDYIFTVNEEDKNYLIDHGYIAQDKVMNINSVGIDTDVFDPDTISDEYKLKLKADLGLADKPIIGFTGRLVKEKGILELIDAFIKVHETSPCQLLMIGSALLNERDTKTIELFKHKIKEHTIEADIFLLGHRDDVPEILSLMDIFVLPSYREGMPVSLLEAMSMGLPVIATDIRGCREEITPTTGILVPMQDAQALADAMLQLITDPPKAKYMGVQARKRVQQYFSTQQSVAKQVEIFEQIKT